MFKKTVLIITCLISITNFSCAQDDEQTNHSSIPVIRKKGYDEKTTPLGRMVMETNQEDLLRFKVCSFVNAQKRGMLRLINRHVRQVFDQDWKGFLNPHEALIDAASKNEFNRVKKILGHTAFLSSLGACYGVCGALTSAEAKGHDKVVEILTQRIIYDVFRLAASSGQRKVLEALFACTKASRMISHSSVPYVLDFDKKNNIPSRFIFEQENIKDLLCERVDACVLREHIIAGIVIGLDENAVLENLRLEEEARKKQEALNKKILDVIKEKIAYEFVKNGGVTITNEAELVEALKTVGGRLNCEKLRNELKKINRFRMECSYQKEHFPTEAFQDDDFEVDDLFDGEYDLENDDIAYNFPAGDFFENVFGDLSLKDSLKYLICFLSQRGFALSQDLVKEENSSKIDTLRFLLDNEVIKQMCNENRCSFILDEVFQEIAGDRSNLDSLDFSLDEEERDYLLEQKHRDDFTFLITNDRTRRFITRRCVNKSFSCPCSFNCKVLDIVNICLSHDHIRRLINEEGVNSAISNAPREKVLELLHIFMNNDYTQVLINAQGVNNAIKKASDETVLDVVKNFMGNPRTKKLINKDGVKAAITTINSQTVLNVIKIFMGYGRTKKLIDSASVTSVLANVYGFVGLEIIKIFIEHCRTKITQKGVDTFIDNNKIEVVCGAVELFLTVRHTKKFISDDLIKKLFSRANHARDCDFMEFLLLNCSKKFKNHYNKFSKEMLSLSNALIKIEPEFKRDSYGDFELESICYAAYYNKVYTIDLYIQMYKTVSNIGKKLFDVMAEMALYKKLDMAFVLAAKKGNLEIVKILATHVSQEAVNEAFCVAGKQKHCNVLEFLVSDLQEKITEQTIVDVYIEVRILPDEFSAVIDFLKKNDFCYKYIKDMVFNDLVVDLFLEENEDKES